MTKSPTLSRKEHVFSIKPGTSNFKDLNKELVRDKVYDEGLLERIFPKKVIKGSICNEVSMQEGRVDCTLDLIELEAIGDLGKQGKPYIHVGCLAIALMPLGKRTEGKVHVILRDGRLNSGHDVIAHFKCDLSKPLSAFAEFPNFFVSTQDLLNGFSMHVSILGEGMQFRDGVHPISVQLTSILRGCDEDMGMRYALSTLGAPAYQPLLNSEKLEGAQEIDYTRNEGTLVMPEVYDVIKKLNLKHNGELIRGSENERDYTDITGVRRRVQG